MASRVGSAKGSLWLPNPVHSVRPVAGLDLGDDLQLTNVQGRDLVRTGHPDVSPEAVGGDQYTRPAAAGVDPLDFLAGCHVEDDERPHVGRESPLAVCRELDAVDAPGAGVDRPDDMVAGHVDDRDRSPATDPDLGAVWGDVDPL